MLNSVLKREHSSLCYRLFNLSRARSPPQLIKTWKKTTLTWESEKTVLIKGADIQSGPQICGCFSLSKTVCVIWGIKHSSSGFSPVRKWVQRRGFKFKSEDHSATAYGTIPTETLFRCCIFGVFFLSFFFFTLLIHVPEKLNTHTMLLVLDCLVYACFMYWFWCSFSFWTVKCFEPVSLD